MRRRRHHFRSRLADYCRLKCLLPCTYPGSSGNTLGLPFVSVGSCPRPGRLVPCAGLYHTLLREEIATFLPISISAFTFGVAPWLLRLSRRLAQKPFGGLLI